MRFHGKLTSWNDDRGFGFITPTVGQKQIFVHISAFPHDGSRPQLNEALSFEIGQGADGKQRAIAIVRAGQSPVRKQLNLQRPRSKPRIGLGGWVFGAALLGWLATYGYGQIEQRWPLSSWFDAHVAGLKAQSVKSTRQTPERRCDGRTHCSQMTSCAEARFFLRNCPGTEMDGDNDGIPCEKQWCNSGFGG